MVTLVNRLNQKQDFNLDHEGWCTELECFCVPTKVVTVDENRKGIRAPREVVRNLPTSLTMLAKEKGNFPDRILKVVEVAAALEKGTLLKVSQV